MTPRIVVRVLGHKVHLVSLSPDLSHLTTELTIDEAEHLVKHLKQACIEIRLATMDRRPVID